MKTKIILVLTLTVFSFTSLLAQKKIVHKAVANPKTAAPKAIAQSTTTTADMIAKAYDAKESVTCSVSALPEGCLIVFTNPSSSVVTDIVEKQKEEQSLIIKKYLIVPNNNSIKDITSVEFGKDREQAKPVAESFVVTENENTNSASPNADAVAVNDIHFLISINGNKTELKVSDGECKLPANIADGSYPVTVIWSWGMSYKALNNSGAVSLWMNYKGGRCLDVNENRLTEEKTTTKEPVKTTTTTIKKPVKKGAK